MTTTTRCIGSLPAGERVLYRRRVLKDRAARVLVYSAFALAVIPLVSLLATMIARGAPRLFTDFPYFLTVSMNGVYGGMIAGGIYHALLGTLLITLWATLLSVPVGVLCAIYLTEYGPGRPLAKAISFFVDVMTGIPSIVAGLFAAAVFALAIGPEYRSGIIGALALAVLMIPTVVRSSEEMLRLVPAELREAALALGAPQWKVVVTIVLRTALGGLITGVLLGIARVIGETAPLLVTVGTLDKINGNVFSGRMMTLPVYVYRQYAQGAATCPAHATDCVPTITEERAWAAALVLLALVLALNLAGRTLARVFAPKGRS